MWRIIVRLILIIATIIAIAAIIMPLYILGTKASETWAVIAAALAVITSVLTSWFALRVLEIQQDEKKPYPYPSIDVRSRYGLMQLRITNKGGSPACNINIKWNKPLINIKEEVVRFIKQENAPDIPILLSNESIAILIGGVREMYNKYNNMNYSGIMEFQDVSGRKIKHTFYLSAETYRSTLDFMEEEGKTQMALQKVPEEIEKLRNEVIEIRKKSESKQK
jgi:hypothetical protein